MKIAMILVMTVLGAGTALAAQWKPVNVTPGRSIYIDMDVPVRTDTTAQAWEWHKFSKEQTAKTWEGKFHGIKSLTRYDCARRTSEPLMRLYLDNEGVEVKRLQVEGLQFPTKVEPDSLREKLLDLACKAPKTAVPANAEVKPGSGLMPEAAAAEVPGEGGAKSGPKPKLDEADAKQAQAVASPEGPAAKNTDPKAGPPAEPVKVALLSKAGETPGPKLRVVRKKPAKPRHASPVAPVRTAGATHSATGLGGHAPHWSYVGEFGVDRWGTMKTEYATCGTGKYQSPIDIRDGARLDLETITFGYAPSGLRIIDNGHTVQVNIDAGRYIIVGGKRYELKQFHFHKPAEERIDGRSYEMVAHLVHKSADDRLAVVAVLFEAGGENGFLRRLWPYLPLEQGVETVLPDVRVELEGLLPENRGYYTYMGSLTTPPCTEGVLWIVMKTPVPVAIEQVSVFGRLYPMNARPIQPANGRLVKESP